jgi:hypothetical protein
MWLGAKAQVYNPSYLEVEFGKTVVQDQSGQKVSKTFISTN